MKMPAFQFYPADWRKDPGVQALGYFERGVWFEMLCLMHESEERGVLMLAGNPIPAEALGHVLGLDNQILETTLTKLLTYGVAKRRQSDGAIYSKRMVVDEKTCQARRKAGKMGGNPVLLNQIPTTGVKQISTPSSSTSVERARAKRPVDNSTNGVTNGKNQPRAKKRERSKSKPAAILEARPGESQEQYRIRILQRKGKAA